MQNIESSRGKPTISGDAYNRIRSDILTGRLEPGKVLRSDWMREQYDIGISPLREALTRLTSERLIVSESQRGFRVAPIDISEVRDVLETRTLIEIQALRRSIELGSIEWEGRILAAYHVLSRNKIPRPGDADSAIWIENHRNFHMALLSASKSVWLPYLAQMLFDQSERYRALRTVIEEKAELERDIGQEHKRILDATLARDADEACHALVDHYTRTSDFVVKDIEAAAAKRKA